MALILRLRFFKYERFLFRLLIANASFNLIEAKDVLKADGGLEPPFAPAQLLRFHLTKTRVFLVALICEHNALSS